MGLDYWFSLPLPFRLRANINNAFSSMRAAGMQADAPAYMAGHSMGGSIGQDVALEFFERGELQGLIALASYLNVKYFPPVSTDGFSYPMPTLTVGAEMNYGAGRLSRIAAAAYRQRQNNVSGLDYPVVLIEGINHMQFATGYEKEDLMPERGDEVLQTEVARVSVDYIKQQLGLGGGSIVAQDQNRTRAFLTPIERAFEYEGSPNFGATEYKPMGPLWVSSELKYDEKEQSLELVSAGIFTEPGDRTSRGNHYCKLLSPARAMEYVLLDGLKRKLFRKWCGLRECA